MTILHSSAFDKYQYARRDVSIMNHSTGKVVFQAKDIELPTHWSQTACNVAVDKYFRKTGVPSETVMKPMAGGMFGLGSFRPSVPAPHATMGSETSIKQVIHRMAGAWTYGGLLHNYFKDIEHSEAFYSHLVDMLIGQMAAPNSPQWFNTGLWWAYGIEGKPQGHSYVDLPHGRAGVVGDDMSYRDAFRHAQGHLTKSTNTYERAQAHACFILNVEDSMMGNEGIVEWYEREARIFKGGSGAGANVSKLRAEGEALSSGGRSSGLMSWIAVADRSAGAIKSGGTTRRAAKMVVLDIDHPDILKFVGAKLDAEVVAAGLVCGSALVDTHGQHLVAAYVDSGAKTVTDALGATGVREAVSNAARAGVPHNYISKALAMAAEGASWIGKTIGGHFEGAAYDIAPYQNANHSVMVPDAFYRAIDKGEEWATTNRNDGSKAWSVPAAEIEHTIAKAAWVSGDPGVAYSDTINWWNVTPNDGAIRACNPCAEHWRPDNSACNLASLRLTAFYKDGHFDAVAYIRAVHTWMMVLDITVSVAQFPDDNTAVNTYLWRDTGLGYADLGALLMSMGLAYDSNAGRAMAGAITALHHGAAIEASAAMAEMLGAYPTYRSNREAHMRCIQEHAIAAGVVSGEVSAPGIMAIDWSALPNTHVSKNTIERAVRRVWLAALKVSGEHGLRNAEATVLAPTGTISLIMGCDTTGVEPMFSLKTTKELVGGGSLQMVAANCVTSGLTQLGYTAQQIKTITDHVAMTGTMPTHTLKPEHRAVFAVAMDTETIPAIAFEAHILMMAAAQAFISGAISKTINMPSSATIADIKRAYRMGHQTGCKSMALYRDGSKLSQPLSGGMANAIDEIIRVAAEGDVATDSPAHVAMTAPPQSRSRLGTVRQAGIDICVGFGGNNVYVRTTRYDDGRLGEIWVTFSGDQGTIGALITNNCKAINIALQYGLPVQDQLDSWMSSHFSPTGSVSGHPYIKTARSILNLAARLIYHHEFGVVDASILNVMPPTDTTTPVAPAVVKHATPKMVDKASGFTCPSCGSARYVTSGAGCRRCLDCGHTGGCGG
jgi:ribonucleoside-diphosphate reductase alpha chain